jgi:hypothetical protein
LSTIITGKFENGSLNLLPVSEKANNVTSPFSLSIVIVKTSPFDN